MKREKIVDPWNIPQRRASLKGIGFTREQIERPTIGVMNSWGENSPAAGHLDHLAKRVKAGIESAGGTPMEFAMSALCHAPAGGTRGASYSLAYRDIVADFVELIAEVNLFDGIVFTTVCDDVVPAHLMAAARLNIPSIIMLGGYMLPRIYKGKAHYLVDVGMTYAKVQRGEVSQEEFEEMAEIACGNFGACPVMGTGNTMGAIAESLGMTLPGCSTVSGSDPIIVRLAYQTGQQIMTLVKKGIRPSDILTMKNFENAIRVFLSLGGSTNALVHIPAIAAELEMEIPLSLFDSLSRETPFLVNIKPGGKHTMKEFDEAGGMSALIKELGPLLHSDTMTVTGKTLLENVRRAKVFDREVIYPLLAPIAKEGAVAILRGNMAPNGAVVKISGLVGKELRKHGPAKVFNSEKEACERLFEGEIKPGDIVVIRSVGPKGDPGMRVTSRFLWFLSGMKLDEAVTVISDGRFSGTNRGGAIGHVSPEAAEGGPIAAVRDGDIIDVNIPRRTLELRVPEEEIKKRLKDWKPPKRKLKKGLLARISKTMLPVEKGAILQRNF
jgi:dihydroxy-acid dehydratase